MTRLVTVFILALLVVVGTAAPLHAYLIDKVAAEVDGSVITRGEMDRVVEEEALRRGITGTEDYSRLRQEVLDSLIDRKLLLAEARKFKLVDVSDEEVDKALASVKAKFGTEDAFAAAMKKDEMTVDELREDLREQLLALKYVDRRIKFFVRVTLDDQKKYYAENQEKFKGKSFSDSSDEIYATLLERETDRKLKEYIKELRAKSEITVKPVE